MRQLFVLFLTLLLSFKAYALDSIEDYIKEYPNQEQVKMMRAWLEHNSPGTFAFTGLVDPSDTTVVTPQATVDYGYNWFSLSEAPAVLHTPRYERFFSVSIFDMLHNVPAVIVNPSTPIGARDIKPTPTGRIIVDFVNGRMPAYVDTGLNLVHVDDCARGHLLAFERGKIGERYILGGEDLTLREILLALGRITGRPAPGVRLPNRLLVPFAYGVEGWARLSGMEPRLTVDSLRMARKYMFFSSEKAKRELDFTSRSAEQALSDAVEWFGANNYFKSAVSPAIQSR